MDFTYSTMWKIHDISHSQSGLEEEKEEEEEEEEEEERRRSQK